MELLYKTIAGRHIQADNAERYQCDNNFPNRQILAMRPQPPPPLFSPSVIFKKNTDFFLLKLSNNRILKKKNHVTYKKKFEYSAQKRRTFHYIIGGNNLFCVIYNFWSASFSNNNKRLGSPAIWTVWLDGWWSTLIYSYTTTDIP